MIVKLESFKKDLTFITFILNVLNIEISFYQIKLKLLISPIIITLSHLKTLRTYYSL